LVIELERQMAAEMAAHRLAVDPDLGRVGGGAEAQHDLLPAPGRRHDNAPQIPGDAQIVARVLELLVPAGGHGDAARRRQGAEPPVFLADLLRVQLERPEAGEVEEVSVGVLLGVEGHASSTRALR
jgi:hypothetical protein